MPIYEYVCEKCGSQLEVLQKVTDEPLKRCRKCRGKLEKIVSRTSFQLKGGGWYKTDYSSKPAAKAEDKSDKAGNDKAGKKTEATSGESSGTSASKKTD
jgi:putative FmdB family regulatory protein